MGIGGKSDSLNVEVRGTLYLAWESLRGRLLLVVVHAERGDRIRIIIAKLAINNFPLTYLTVYAYLLYLNVKRINI